MTAIRPLALSLLASAALVLPACSAGNDAGGTTTPVAEGETLKTAAPPTMPNPDVIGETLATVNGMPVGAKEFDALALRSKGRESALDAEARQEVMDRLVEEKLLYQAALAQGIDKDPKIQKMMVNTLLKQEVYASVRTSDISEDDLRAYFEEHKNEFVVPEKVQIKRIVIEPEHARDVPATDASEEAWAAAKATAEEVRGKVMERKSDFRKLAQEHSAGAYARRGGDLGFVTDQGKPGIPPEVVAEGFKLDKGDVSGLFKTDQGWNIVYVPNRRERVERTFEQMRGSVLRKVKSDRYKSLYEGYVSKLKEGATISVDDAKLSAHKVEGPSRPALKAPGDDPAPVGEPDTSEDH